MPRFEQDGYSEGMSDETSLALAGKTAAQELGKDAAKGLERVAVDLYGDGIRPYAQALGTLLV